MKYVIITIILALLFIGCARDTGHPVLSDLDIEKEGLELHDNALVFPFTRNNDTLLKALTVKQFGTYTLTYTPVRNDKTKSFSFFIHYQDQDNYYRLNLFLDTGKVHLYKKMGKKVDNLIFDTVKSADPAGTDDVYRITVENNTITLGLNNTVYYTNTIDYSKGKVGVGAYGKKGERATIFFKDNGTK